MVVTVIGMRESTHKRLPLADRAKVLWIHDRPNRQRRAMNEITPTPKHRMRCGDVRRCMAQRQPRS
jgi:hypothetical protein